MMIYTNPIKKQHPVEISSCANKISIEGRLFCQKCMADHNTSRTFRTCQSLFYHLTKNHSDNDKMVSPSRDECLSTLQIISDSIILGVLR